MAHIYQDAQQRERLGQNAPWFCRWKDKAGKSRAKKVGSKVSASTINNDLRTIRTALRRAKKWKYLREIPDFDFLKEPTKLKRYVTEEHFQAIYEACHVAGRPTGLPFAAEQWWQSVITFAYLTGWRINELLTLRREPGTSCGDIKLRATQKIESVDQKIQDLQRIRDALARMVLKCQGRGRLQDCGVHRLSVPVGKERLWPWLRRLRRYGSTRRKRLARSGGQPTGRSLMARERTGGKDLSLLAHHGCPRAIRRHSTVRRDVPTGSR